LIDARYEYDGKVIGFKYGDHTALHVAARHNYEEGVIFLLEHGANVKIKTCDGIRAIDFVKDKNGPIAKLLRENRMLYDLRKRIRRNLKNEESEPDAMLPNIIDDPQTHLPTMESGKNKKLEVVEEIQENNQIVCCCRVS
jgi:ankyrin repeat protein